MLNEFDSFFILLERPLPPAMTDLVKRVERKGERSVACGAYKLGVCIAVKALQSADSLHN